MLIAFCGDTHGHIHKMYQKLLNWEARTGLELDAVVQVGDFGIFNQVGDFSEYWKGQLRAPIPTYVIVGNHEDYSLINQWLQEPDKMPDLYLIPDGGIVTLNKNGTDEEQVSIAGVWGNYSPRSWEDPERVHFNRKTNASPRIAAHIDRDAVERLLKIQSTVDVLVTHDSAQRTLPTKFLLAMEPLIQKLLGLEKNEQPGGCPGFDQLLLHFKPKRYFFGHLHYGSHHISETTKSICLQAIDYAKHEEWFCVVQFPEEN